MRYAPESFGPRRGEDGFTLIEVLVTLTLLAAIVAIVAPTLFSQLDQGDSTQLQGDLQNVANGVKTFRVDVSPTFPGDVEDLVNQVDGSDTRLDGSGYNSGQEDRWNGPYLEIDDVASTTVAFTSGFGGSIANSLINGTSSSSISPGDATGWVVVEVNELTSDALTTMEDEFDDGASTTGRFRHDTNSTLYYLAVQK